jgi:hypothetical protein
LPDLKGGLPPWRDKTLSRVSRQFLSRVYSASDHVFLGHWKRIANAGPVPACIGPINFGEGRMPEKATVRRARKDAREGKAPSTQAGEFVREEIHHVREGKHGARSTKQAIAIGLSKARRAGVKLPPPKKGQASKATRRAAKKALTGGRRRTAPSARRSRAVRRALKREGGRAASSTALARQARAAAKRRPKSQRSAAARKAARTRARKRAR